MRRLVNRLVPLVLVMALFMAAGCNPAIFVTRPISLAVLILAALVLSTPALRAATARRRGASQSA